MILRLAIALAFCASQATAECRQALALGLDVSGSVDAREYRLQLDGLAGALTSAPVRAALLDPALPPVRLAVFEWSGRESQRLIRDWTVIASEADLVALAAGLTATQRQLTDTETGLGPALAYGGALLDRSGPCFSRTLDISGDGKANHGPRPNTVKLALDITVNGLVIGADAPRVGDLRQMEVAEISSYYRAMVIRGPGAFVEVALGFEGYQEAMTRKLIRELRVLAIGVAPQGAGASIRPVSLSR